jgi:hypothetical protein
MPIDPKLEEPTRTTLGQAIRGELDELDKMINTVGDEVYGAIIAYCTLAAAYIAIDVSERWPNDVDIQTIARHAATTSSKYQLREQDVHDYIARVALAGEVLTDVFSPDSLDIRLPVLITAQMLLSYRPPRGMDLWEYLDTIWNAINASERADMSILPALLIRQQRDQAAAKR